MNADKGNGVEKSCYSRESWNPAPLPLHGGRSERHWMTSHSAVEDPAFAGMTSKEKSLA